MNGNAFMGHIGTKFTGYTALSSTTEQLLGGANLKLPDAAKEVLGIFPYLTSPAGNTAAEPVAGYASVQSDDCKPNPFYVLPSPIGSSLLKSVAQVQGKSEFYPMHMKVSGGEELKIYGNGLFNHTIEPYMGVLVVYSDMQTGLPQVFSKISTFTNTGTAAGNAGAHTVTVTGGSKLVEIGGLAVGTTVAALKGVAGHLLISSDDFSPSWLLHCPIEPASGQVDTNIQEAIAAVARKEVAINMRSKAIVNVSFTLAVALTTTGNFIAQLMYN